MYSSYKRNYLVKRLISTMQIIKLASKINTTK